MGVQTISVQQHLYSTDRKRVFYEKWVKTCPSYSWTAQVSCDSLVQKLHLKSSSSAESQAGGRLEFILNCQAAASWVQSLAKA